MYGNTGRGVSTAVSLQSPARQTSAAPDRRKAQKYSLKVGLSPPPVPAACSPGEAVPANRTLVTSAERVFLLGPFPQAGDGIGVPGLRAEGALLNLAGPAFRAAGPRRRQPDRWLDTGHGSSTSGAVTPRDGTREWLQGTPGVCTSTPTSGRWPEEGASSTRTAVPTEGPQAADTLGRAGPGGPQWHAAATRGRCWPQAAGGQDPGDAHAHPGAPLRPPQSPEGPRCGDQRAAPPSPRLPGACTRVPPVRPAGTPVGPPTPPSSVKPPAGLS